MPLQNGNAKVSACLLGHTSTIFSNQFCQVLFDFPIYIAPTREESLIDFGGEAETKVKRLPDGTSVGNSDQSRTSDKQVYRTVAFLSVEVNVSDSKVLTIDKNIQLPPPLNDLNVFRVSQRLVFISAFGWGQC